MTIQIPTTFLSLLKRYSSIPYVFVLALIFGLVGCSGGNSEPATDPNVTGNPVVPASDPNPETTDPVTPDPVTPDPVTPDPVTPDPVTPDPVTPDPVTPDPVTPDPVTPDPVTPDPVTPDPNVSSIISLDNYALLLKHAFNALDFGVVLPRPESMNLATFDDTEVLDDVYDYQQIVDCVDGGMAQLDEYSNGSDIIHSIKRYEECRLGNTIANGSVSSRESDIREWEHSSDYTLTNIELSIGIGSLIVKRIDTSSAYSTVRQTTQLDIYNDRISMVRQGTQDCGEKGDNLEWGCSVEYQFKIQNLEAGTNSEYNAKSDFIDVSSSDFFGVLVLTAADGSRVQAQSESNDTIVNINYVDSAGDVTEDQITYSELY